MRSQLTGSVKPEQQVGNAQQQQQQQLEQSKKKKKKRKHSFDSIFSIGKSKLEFASSAANFG